MPAHVTPNSGVLSFRLMLNRRLVATCALLLGLHGTVLAQAPAQNGPDAIRLGPVELRGYVHFDYRAELGAAPDREQVFSVRRARLLLTGPLGRDITWTVSAEATTVPVLRDAYVTLHFLPAATVRLGQAIMPYSLERYVYSANTMEFTERVLLDLAPGRDVGVVVFNERPFFGWLSYGAAIGNGTGQNVRDDNGAKDTMLRVTASPRRVAGLEVGVNAARGTQPSGVRTRAGGDINFERRSYHVAVEVLRETTEDGRQRTDGLYALGSWRIYPKSPRRLLHHLEVGARFTRRTARAAASISEWDLAANYYVHRQLRIMWNVIVPTERRPDGPGATVHGRMNIRF